MRGLITSLGEVAGLGLVSVGAFMVAPALGLVVGGAALFAVAFVAGGDG